MFANLCFQVLDYFNITSNETVKMAIAVFLALLVFGVFYFVVKFTGLEINNLNQNVLALFTVDIISFTYLMYKRKQELDVKIKEETLKENQPLDNSQNQPIDEKPIDEKPINGQLDNSQNQPIDEKSEVEKPVNEQLDNEVVDENTMPQNIEEKIKEIIEEEKILEEQ